MDGGNSTRTGSLSPLTVRLLVKGRLRECGHFDNQHRPRQSIAGARHYFGCARCFVPPTAPAWFCYRSWQAAGGKEEGPLSEFIEGSKHDGR